MLALLAMRVANQGEDELRGRGNVNTWAVVRHGQNQFATTKFSKNRFRSANILRESCVCLGVTGVLNDEKRSSETHRTETARLKEGAMNGGSWTLILGCQDAKQFAERSANPLLVYPQRC